VHETSVDAGVEMTVDRCVSIVGTMFEPSVGFSIGAELEFVSALADGSRPGEDQLRDVFDGIRLPAGGRLTLEPGSQVELSTAPAASVAELRTALAVDLAVLSAAFENAGVTLHATAIDTRRAPRRTTDSPRYVEMERKLDQFSPAGRWMMTNTASLQINIGNGNTGPLDRWRVLWHVAPLLTAIFANSPGRDDHGDQWRSLRQGCWLAMDPRRVGLPALGARDHLGYAEFALDAPVLLVLDDRGTLQTPCDLTFRQWIEAPDRIGVANRPPTETDFRYHLTTLFPDIRPRGWMELRCIDMIPVELVSVALGVVAALVRSPTAMGAADLLPPTSMSDAARSGLADPVIRASAMALLDIAACSADHDPDLPAAEIRRFRAEYTSRGRSPADRHRLPAQRLTPPLRPPGAQ
jgi:glutamate--cysteine ligase